MHIGRGLNHGHYVAVVKSGGRWLLFDDEIVELVNEQVCVCVSIGVLYPVLLLCFFAAGSAVSFFMHVCTFLFWPAVRDLEGNEVLTGVQHPG